MNKIKNLFQRYSELKTHKVFYLQLGLGVLFLVVSLFFNYAANTYTAASDNTVVRDIILDNIPAIRVDGIFFEGVIMLVAFIALLGLASPKRIPFLLKSIAVFVAVRSFFLVLTHLAPPVHPVLVPSNNFLERLASGSGSDLFFSGHTGLPFLMAMLFWRNKYLRVIFLCASVFFGATVLLGHLHYSIDVFSAFFITYGIYRISMRIFPSDYKFFESSLKP